MSQSRRVEPVPVQVVLERLQRRREDEAANLDESVAQFGHTARYTEAEVPDTPTPLIDTYFRDHINGQGNSRMVSMCNFSMVEFEFLWGAVESDMAIAWDQGRGRKPVLGAKDAVFVTLAILKHYDTWEKHGLDFGVGAPTLERLTHRVIDTVTESLYRRFVKPLSMKNQRDNGYSFANYPYALYATDVKFQPSYRPKGRFQEQKEYYSAKHKLYGMKIEVSVAPPGVAFDMSDAFPGSKSDLTILLDRVDVHKKMLKKQSDSESDFGEGSQQFGDSWAVLVDKGYQGAGQVVRALHPKKKPMHGQLDHADITRNEAISSDRVLVENYFGRMCQLWNVAYMTFKWNRSRFDLTMKLCVALTNYHVDMMPLRQQDSDHYLSVLAKYHSMAESTRTRQAQYQREYRARRAVRTATSPYNLASPPFRSLNSQYTRTGSSQTRGSPYDRDSQ